MLMAVAATVPTLSAVPRAVTHCPTLSAAAVAFFDAVYVVAAFTKTVTGEAAGDAVAPPVPGRLLRTTKPLALFDTTLPNSPPPNRRPPGAPDGRPPPPGAPDGRIPGKPPPGPGPPAPAVHDPLTGAVTATDVAVTDVAGVLPVDAPALRTITHEPTVTSAAVAVTVSVNDVVAP
jgi:hypothetical protein